MSISEEVLKAIVKSIINYFEKFNIGEVRVFPSYLGDNGILPCHDYTGLINISGEYRGVIYFSASELLARKLTNKLGYEWATDNCLDLVSEMSNIFAGNLRKVLGANFNISVPTATTGPLHHLHIDALERPCIIPIEYDGHKSMVAIYFDKD